MTISRQAQRQRNLTDLLGICKADRDAMAAAITDANRRAEFLRITGLQPGRKSITRNPPETSPARSPTKA